MKKTSTFIRTFVVATLGLMTAQPNVAHAQDAVFGQFYAAPVYLNPALTGVFGGQWRINSNYRQQWTNVFSQHPLQTFHFGADYKIRVMDDDFLSIGTNFLRDELGGDAQMNRTYGNLSLSFMKQLNGSRYRNSDQYLIFGLQGGMGQHATGNSLWFDRQFDGVAGNVNTALPSGELNPQAGKIYPDFNAGLMWYSVMDENKSIYVGISGHHILQPNISFFNNSKENLYRRLSLNFGGEIPFSDQLSILPAWLLTLQGPSMTSAFGANFRYSNHDWNEIAVRIGGWYRIANRSVWKEVAAGQPQSSTSTSVLSDALTASAIMEMGRWNVGISYDIHLSTIARPTTTRGAFELSLIYIHPEERRVKTNCPKF